MSDSKCCLSQELKKRRENPKLSTSRGTVCCLTDELATLRGISTCDPVSKSVDENAVNFLKSFLYFYLDKMEIEKPNGEIDLFMLLDYFGSYAQDISTHILKNGEAKETTQQDALSLFKLYSQFSLMKGSDKSLSNKFDCNKDILN